MNYGVTVTYGLRPWQILQQREDHTAKITVGGEYHLVHLSQELPIQFENVEHRKTTVKARIALESTGESVTPWQECRIVDDSHWEMTFESIPAGGLYRLETYMDYEGWDGLSCTRGDMIHHFGVGDVFVIAGQSNAAGRAKNTVQDDPELGVHVLRSNAVWDLATHPLGETTGAVHVGHYENHNPGHSPWLHFAKRLKRELGYPIGLIPCAYGGAPLRWWNPEENGALLQNMLDMLGDYDIHPKAVLWYQGEAEGYEDSAETYLSRFECFVNATRKALDQPDLPFVTVQLNRCMEKSDLHLDRQWGIVREAQRQAAYRIPGVTVVPSTDLAMYDFIHVSAQGNLVLGERCARALLRACYGKDYDDRAPEPEEAILTQPDTVHLRFSRIRNWVNPFDVKGPDLPIEAEDDEGIISPVSYVTGNDSLTITFARPLGKNARLHGMWRTYPGIGIPCDCMRLPVMSFYGFPITQKGPETP